MTAKCRTWRPVNIEGHPFHRPGTCVRCWKPCRHRVPAEGDRCDVCWEAIRLSQHDGIRWAALQNPPAPPERVLMAFVGGDPAPDIAEYASELLAERAAESVELIGPVVPVEPADPDDDWWTT